jgi:hypothetical protein
MNINTCFEIGSQTLDSAASLSLKQPKKVKNKF